MVDVRFINAHKEFDDGYVGVDRLNLDIADGEFLVLLGPSGCGKSTTLRLLAGLEDLSDGEIQIDGVRVNDLPAAARGLGMVFQSYALYPHMTVSENLSFGLRMAPKADRVEAAEIARRVSEIAELLTLEKELEKKPRELSGGQRQRVAIGRALVRRPKVLLMDEPLSNLDAKLRNRMRRDLRRLHEQHGTTTVYVTHDQVEAMTLADRVAIMSDGKLQQHATPNDAYHHPANAFVASFLGTPATNLIEGVAKDGRFTAGDLSFDLPDHLKHVSGPGQYGVRPEYAQIAKGSGIPAKIDIVENLGGEAVFNLDVFGHAVRILYHRSGAEQRNYHDVVADGHVEIDLAVPSAMFFEG
ncbi:MAG: ABC transporter ATP-binding protein [Henriciella sp.]|nr:ABC transporter ATP-binding protein [Henriciella sp.]